LKKTSCGINPCWLHAKSKPKSVFKKTTEANRKRKKTDVAEHPKEFDHVGILINGPPGTAGLPFNQSSDNFQVALKKSLMSLYRLERGEPVERAESTKPAQPQGRARIPVNADDGNHVAEGLADPTAIEFFQGGAESTCAAPWPFSASTGSSPRNKKGVGITPNP
jgi:hypothetical protein